MNLVSIEILFAGMKSFSNFSVICRDKIIIGVCNNIFLSFFCSLERIWSGGFNNYNLE